MSSAVHGDLNHDKEPSMMINFSDSKLIVLVIVVDTSRTSSCFTVLLLRGKSGTCCSTVFLMSVNFPCPDLYSSATRFTASSPGIPCSPYTVDYNIIINIDISFFTLWVPLYLLCHRNTQVNKLIPGGHICVLHSVFSVPVCIPSKLLPPPVIPSHGIPPYASCVLTKRLRNLIPPPHVTVHEDHKFHSWYSQSMGQWPSTINFGV